MATFKAEIQNKRSDGTYNVRIRVTHNRVVRRLSTNLYVTDADITKSKKIKNAQVIDKSNEIISKCRIICNDIGFGLARLSVDELVDKLRRGLLGGERFELDFIEYMDLKSESMKKGTGDTYRTAANALRRYMQGDTLDISDVTVTFLQKFEAFLKDEPVQRGKQKSLKAGRAKSAYLETVRATHNLAKGEYNDEENGVIVIPGSPFKKYEIKPRPRTRKRALPISVIQQIINLPDDKRRRRTLAKDCFILSFALIGMNSADMYYADKSVRQKRDIISYDNGETTVREITEDVIIYNRLKTTDRRDDKAEMHVKIDGCITRLMEKYRDSDRAFNFHRKYKNHNGFNKALNEGLKIVGEEVGVEDLEYYAARHSWATIARSAVVGIDKATVHEALNHVDDKMKVTDIYIDRDWSVIWNANEKVLALFDWTAIGYDVL